jgi:HEAT repeat protein
MFAVDRLRRVRAQRLLLSGDLDVMADGAQGLVRLEARAELRAALADRNPYVREFAAGALAEVAADEDVPRYVEMLDSRTLMIADIAQEYLATVGDRALPLVVQRVLASPATVSLDALELLGQIGSDRAVPALQAVTAHGDASQCEFALDALARIGGTRARGVVEAVHRDAAHSEDRHHAARLLETWL